MNDTDADDQTLDTIYKMHILMHPILPAPATPGTAAKRRRGRR